MATEAMLNRLPALDDDAFIGVEMEHIVQRDGEADLKFVGTLLASAAPDFRDQDRWREYRVYKTVGGRYVFSKIGRSIRNDEQDRFEASTWEEGKPDKQWQRKDLKDALTGFFKWDQLAKQLYAKLSVDTAERLE